MKKLVLASIVQCIFLWTSEWLSVKLQGSGKILDVALSYIKAFDKKFAVFKRDVDGERFIYFPSLKKHINDLPNDNRTDRKSLWKLFFDIIESVVEQYFTNFSKLRELEEIAKFMRFQDSMKLRELSLQIFSWMDIVELEMQLIEFQSSKIRKKSLILGLSWK